MKKSIEFTENVLEEKVEKLEQSVCELQRKFKKVEKDVTYMNDYVEDAENIHDIERAHKAGRKSRNKPRTIVCKLLRFKDKQNILRKAKLLKGTNIFINEDYCQDTVEYRKELWEEVKVLRSQGKIAYLNYRSIVSRDKVPALSSETEISEY